MYINLAGIMMVKFLCIIYTTIFPNIMFWRSAIMIRLKFCDKTSGGCFYSTEHIITLWPMYGTVEVKSNCHR